MTVNQKVTGTATTIPAGLAMGLLASILVTAVLSASAAWMILGGYLPESSVGYCSMVILLLASMTGAATATGRIKRLRFQMGLASGGLYFAALLAVTALFFGGVYDGVGVTALMILCGSLLVILLVPGGGKRAGSRKRKTRQ